MKLSKIQRSIIALFLVFKMIFCFVGGMYIFFKYFDNISAIPKLCYYYLHAEKYQKIKVHIDEWTEPKSFLSSNAGISYNFQKGYLPINILNTKQLNFEFVDFNYEYIDEFHPDPKIVYKQKLKTYKGDDFPDFMESFNYNLDFEIYYSEELWDAFYNPYIHEGLIKNIFFTFKYSPITFLGLFLLTLSVVLYNFLRKWRYEDLTEKEKIQVSQSPFIIMSSIVLFVICAILTIVNIVKTTNIIITSFEDRYINHHQYINKQAYINIYKVDEDWYEMLSGSKNSTSSSKEVVYSYFYGYNGNCYSNEIVESKIPIQICQNRSITSEIPFTENEIESFPANVSLEQLEIIPQKRIVWFNPLNQKAYLPESYEEKHSSITFIFKKLIQNWYLHLTTIVLILLISRLSWFLGYFRNLK